MITVQVPRPAQDRPPWKSVAIIASVGFVIGVAWPRLAGLRIGPSLPEAPSPSVPPSASATVSAAAPSAQAAAGPSSAPLPAPSAPAAPAVAGAVPAANPQAAVPPALSFTSGTVQSCKTPDGDALKGLDCGRLQGIDGIVLPRLHKLADCPEAADATGKLPLVVRVDFARGGISVDLGRNPSVTSPEALLACAKADLTGANAARLTHDNPRYSIGYTVTFGSGVRAPEAAAPSRSASEAAQGSALVVWEVAIIREAPKTGRVLARLQRGTQLRVGPEKDGWYPVQYGDGFAAEGWVYRGAIGR